MPFGSERSHFAHSPHLLAALILLIPPEIGGELKRKARNRGCGLGFCARGPPGPRGSRPPVGALASEPASVGNVHGETKGDEAVLTFLGGAGSFGGGCQAEPTVLGCGIPRPGRSLLWVPPRPPHPETGAGRVGARIQPRLGVLPPGFKNRIPPQPRSLSRAD